MGIPGLLKEIGKGERVALAKLAVGHLEQFKRPLRIAIDAAIWNFQTQAGQGGKNPALRTLFYRLVKLLALPIDPVFVYDGKKKPLTKRGRTVSRYGSCISNEMSKKLIQAFHFPYHTAPGEAEAECAMLQRRGLVDMVMSEDVDAIAFGSTLTLRDWSKDASKHNKSPTHVNLLDLPRIKDLSGLDPDGMILVALLSGGDYDEAGVAGIGSTLACEIARAGFGSDLLELIRRGDEGSIQEWRERLQFELETNESGYFKIKRKAVKVPDTFPERKILDYYLNPAVSEDDKLPELERRWLKVWESELDIQALRAYVGETFDWLYKPGAWKFVRVMAPALLAHQLLRGTADSHIRSAEQITERRKHFVSDGVPELRVSVVPAQIVGLDLEAEQDSPEYLESLAADEDDREDAENEDPGENASVPPSPSKRRKTPPWQPDVPEKLWIAETIVETGARKHLEEWRRIQRELENDPKKFATRTSRKQTEVRRPKAKGGMPTGALLNYMAASKVSGRTGAVVDEAKNSLVSATVVKTTRRRIPGNLPELSSNQELFQSTESWRDLDEAEEPCDGPLPPPAKPIEDQEEGERHLVAKVNASVSKRLRQEGLRTRDALLTQKDLQLAEPQLHFSKALADSGGVQDTVTRRNHRRATTKDRKLAPTNSTSSPLKPPPSGSPVRPRQPIESFFAPFIAASKQKQALTGRTCDEQTTTLVDLPPAMALGLSTNSSATHVHATPRSSLPGTWKAIERDSGSSPRPLLPGPSRAPRVSIVDLTGG